MSQSQSSYQESKSYQLVEGDILQLARIAEVNNCDNKLETPVWAVQQTNCTGCDARGLSEKIAIKYPTANPYKKRRRTMNKSYTLPGDTVSPGSIQISKINHNLSFVNLMGQFDYRSLKSLEKEPSPDSIQNCLESWETCRGYIYGNRESKKDREKWFAEGLRLIVRESLLPKTVLIPWGIGCGYGGGDWQVYEKMISDFADKMKSKDVTVVLVKFRPQPSFFQTVLNSVTAIFKPVT